MIKTLLVDGRGTGGQACVTQYGQVVVAPTDFSASSTVKMEAIDTAYNYIIPLSGSKIVITDILLYANRNVGVNDATVDIYTSDVGPAETTIKETLLETEMLKQASRDLIGLNLIVEEGRWVNGKTDDDDIFCTIMYYYIRGTE